MEVRMNDDVNEKDFSQERKEAEILAEGVIKEVKEDITPFVERLKGVGDAIKKGFGSQAFSYEEAMKYFHEHKNDKPEIAKGALLKKEVDGGFLITQTFLDKDGQLVTGEIGRPLGYKKKVSSLDKELLDVFKNEDLIIVE
jgi:hypothetical protein